MSASLVGSEMCIRDSRPPSVADGLARRPVDDERVEGQSRPRRPSRNAPVSYTHLTLPTICSV
eukprot:5170185-Alexandrium_andersonii.AAC.1